jgi:hypothetical protein
LAPDDEIKEDKRDGACSTHGGGNIQKSLVLNVHKEDLDIVGK